MTNRPLAALGAVLAILACALVAGRGHAEPVAVTVTAPVRVSTPSTYAAACDGAAPGRGMLTRNGVAEPRIAVNPRDARHLVAVWQQDRWTDGGAAGLRGAVSRDGGRSWLPVSAPFSRCGGGTAANGGDYERASDPWVSFAPNGDVYQIALAVSGRAGRRTSAILVSRSTDGGLTWGDPVTLIRDSEPEAFNDKEALTADPTDARFVYAVWDRLDYTRRPGRGPTYFSRTTDGGATWEPPRPIYTPERGSTIANQIVVLPSGELLNVFTLLTPRDDVSGTARTEQSIGVIRSADKGVTWTEPVVVSAVVPIAVQDPDTGADVRAGSVIVEPAVDPRTGAVYVTWQDGRFDPDGRAAIALAGSTDGGQTWTAPVRVSGSPPGVHAFTPNIAVAADGTVAVAYYDLRTNTSDPETLPAGYWLATCRGACLDGGAWHETPVASPFDLDAAPRTDRGYFVGDYEGMAAAGDTFFLAFVLANEADPERPSDVWFATARTAGGAPGPPLLWGR